MLANLLCVVLEPCVADGYEALGRDMPEIPREYQPMGASLTGSLEIGNDLGRREVGNARQIDELDPE